MAGGQALTEHDTVDLKEYIDLRRFTPKLRKLAKHLLQLDKPVTIMDACKAINANYDSIRSMIYKSKQNGNDFHRFIAEQADVILHAGKAEVYKALQKGAVSDSSTSHNYRKTYLQLTGDLKENTNINIGSLSLGININNIQLPQIEDSKGVIDIEPSIPKGKGGRNLANRNPEALAAAALFSTSYKEEHAYKTQYYYRADCTPFSKNRDIGN